MAMLVGLVRRTDTGEIVRIVYPLDDESDDVLDQEHWLSYGLEHLDCPTEMLKFHKDDPRLAPFIEGVMSTPKVF